MQVQNTPSNGNPASLSPVQLAAIMSATARYLGDWSVVQVPGNGRVLVHPGLWVAHNASSLDLPIIAPRIGPMAIALDPQPAKQRDFVSIYAKPPALTGREIIVMHGNGTVEFADGTTGRLAA